MEQINEQCDPLSVPTWESIQTISYMQTRKEIKKLNPRYKKDISLLKPHSELTNYLEMLKKNGVKKTYKQMQQYLRNHWVNVTDFISLKGSYESLELFVKNNMNTFVESIPKKSAI